MFNPFKRKKSSIDVIDLGRFHKKEEAREQAASEVGVGNFLGDLASAATASESSELAVDTERTDRATHDRLSILSERIYKLLERIDLLEHKINRLERRGGIGEFE